MRLLGSFWRADGSAWRPLLGVLLVSSFARVALADAPKVSAREVKGSSVQEVKAEGLIEAPPERVLAVLADLDGYTSTMPSMLKSKLLKRDGNTLWHYGLVDAPIVSRREFVLKIEMTRQPDGTLEMSWNEDNSFPAPHDDSAVRVTLNTGRWTLAPKEGGAKTYASYSLQAAPGGYIPDWVANGSNKKTVQDVFEAIRKAVKLPKYANSPSPIVTTAGVK